MLIESIDSAKRFVALRTLVGCLLQMVGPNVSFQFMRCFADPLTVGTSDILWSDVS